MLRPRFPFTFPLRPPQNDEDAKIDTDPHDDSFKPTPIDIAVVRAMFVRAKRLPPDLVDSIFDDAEYWAHSSVELRQSMRLSGSTKSEDTLLLRSYPLGLVNLGGEETTVPGNSSEYSTSPLEPVPHGKGHSARFFAGLAKYPTPRLISPARKIVFSVRSQDQGWASTRETTSWTWFEAGLERFDADHVCNDSCSNKTSSDALPICALRSLQPEPRQDDTSADYHYDFSLLQSPKWEVKRNKLTEKQWRTHVTTWSYLDDTDPESDGGKHLEEEGRGRETGDGSFVRDLRLGDVVTLWGKARFPGWVNRVEWARIDVYWAI